MTDAIAVTLPDMRLTVEGLAREADCSPWVVARCLALLIEKRLLAIMEDRPAVVAERLWALSRQYQSGN
jgi:hypothetical protein